MQTAPEKWREAASKLREIRAMLDECPTQSSDGHIEALLEAADDLEAEAAEYEQEDA
ncbi:hypothetical protein [Salipiger mucosus]|uniref:Uncharacterized protein n=1 Tax=Salipiger mucosus DSM 16094 TaxID=1123237 RepID=S9QYM9_9RHOB|nr:hypothetical protein [Salipiger mucosus]EPX84748.1 hypothetical protein Salmuc_01321 [Salipiger mucosus DSM 16094]